MERRPPRPLTIPAEEDFDLFAVMSALSDPVRRAIIANIADSPGTSCSNSDFGVTKSALTRHWRVLRESGLIRQEVDGTRHRNWLRNEELERRFPGLIPLVMAEVEGSRRDTV